MLRSAVTKSAIFLLVIAATACGGPRYVAIPGALPTPRDTAVAICRRLPPAPGTEAPPSPGLLGLIAQMFDNGFAGRPLGAQPETETYRNCMYARGWSREDDDTVPVSAQQVSLPGSGFDPVGKSPIGIGDDQIYCLRAITHGPAYRPVLAHIANPYTGLYSAAELTNEAFPTGIQASLIAGYNEEAGRCNGRMLHDMAQAAPRFIAILQRRAKAAKLISVDLINRRITFGEAARRQHASIQAARDAILAAASPRQSRSTP